jgi:succinate dehydrogenase / fumarate reductase, membrane anchor subunit
MSDMRTGLKRVRGLGSAKSGTEHFWHQRLTAIANLPLVTFLVWFIISHLGASRADVLLSVRNPLVAVALLLALFSITWHMRLGMQTIIEDYVHGEGRKLALLILNTFFVAALAACGAYAVLKMGFGF